MSSFTVVVDDTDSRIQYYDNAGRIGGWAADSSGSLDHTGYTGTEYNHTLHTPSVNGASLTFPFVGSAVTVFGSFSDVSSTNIVATWSCFVDQIQIKTGQTIPVDANTNLRTLCEQLQIANGPHELTVNISASSTTLVNFDGIMYDTSDETELESAIVEVTDKTNRVVYGTGWFVDGAYNATTTIGSNMTIIFNGTAVTLQGILPTTGPQSTATYSVDGSSPTSFTLTPRSAGNQSYVYFENLFNATGLSTGVHTLEVVYMGNATEETQTPLIFERFLVTLPPSESNASPNSATSTASSTAFETPSTTPPSSASLAAKKTPVGAIAGGIVGGLIFLSLALLAFFLLKRRRFTRKGLVRPLEDSRTRPNLDPVEYSAIETTAFSPLDLYSASPPVSPPLRSTHSVTGDSLLTSSAVMSRYGDGDSFLRSSAVMSHYTSPSEGSTTGTLSDAGSRTQRMSDMKSLQSMAVTLGRPRTTQVMMHTDSGTRMSVAAEEVEIVEVPPNYTPS